MEVIWPGLSAFRDRLLYTSEAFNKSLGSADHNCLQWD